MRFRRAGPLVAALAAACTSAPAPTPPVEPPAAVAAAPEPAPPPAHERETTTAPIPPGHEHDRAGDPRAGVKTIDPPVEVPGRRHKASARALELVRRADAVTWRPMDHGLRSLRCDVEFETGAMGMGKTVFKATYRLPAAGRGVLTLVSTSKTGGHAREWGDGTYRFHASARCRQTLEDLFEGPSFERTLEPYELEMREESGKPFVLARRAEGETADDRFIDLRFGPEGQVVQDGPGDRGVHPFCSLRRTLTYRREGALFLRFGAFHFDEGSGFEQYKYDTIDGVLLPVRHTEMDSGLFWNLSVSNVQVNKP
jgi:hypothetical protein